jgi:hypothetical protein
MTSFEADSKLRRNRKTPAVAKTIGPFSPQMSMKLLKQANKAYPSKRLNGA